MIYASGSPPTRQAQHGHPTISESFYTLRADWVRNFPGKKLPFYQEIREKHRDALVHKTITYSEVVSGTHTDNTLSVSHRWMKPSEPDPDGEQLKAIKNFLASPKGLKIEYVWMDSPCMPQHQPDLGLNRTAEDTVAFKRMLAQVNMLYLGTTVLILLDLSCTPPTAHRISVRTLDSSLSCTSVRTLSLSYTSVCRPPLVAARRCLPLLDPVRGVAEHAARDAVGPQVGRRHQE